MTEKSSKCNVLRWACATERNLLEGGGVQKDCPSYQESEDFPACTRGPSFHWWTKREKRLIAQTVRGPLLGKDQGSEAWKKQGPEVNSITCPGRAGGKGAEENSPANS